LHSDPRKHRSPPRARRAEPWLVLAAALLFFAIPLRTGLLDPETVLLGVDTATSQLPWSAVEGGAAEPPRNPALADQGTFFYPVYRFVVESWLAGEPPLWNPGIYAGVPCLANPQSGALDPQVLALAGLEAVGGRELFDRGFAFLAWLRLVAAALGAWLLARRLGLARLGAATAAVGYGSCGFLTLWLGHSLAHVAPFLPWALWFVEGLRGRHRARKAAGLAATLAGALLAGHPETAATVGLCSAAWALALLREDRRAGTWALAGLAVALLLAAAGLLPFLEYLRHSGALIARTDAPRSPLDLLGLGIAVVGLGVLLRCRQTAFAGEPGGFPWRFLPGALALGLALGAAAWLAFDGDVSIPFRLLLWPDAHGRPGSGGGYLGAGNHLEAAIAWVPLPVLLLAMAAALSPSGPLRRRGLVGGLAILALLLVLRVPGPVDLYRLLPWIGLGDPSRLAPAAALMLGLLAGEALQSATPARRLAAAAIGAALATVALLHPAPILPPPLPGPPPPAELLGFAHTPVPRLHTGLARLEGWAAAELELDAVHLRVEELDERGRPRAEGAVEIPAELAPEPWSPAGRAAPPGALHFRVSHLDAGRLAPGCWRFSAVLLRDEPDGSRRRLGIYEAGTSLVDRRPWPGFAGWAVALLCLALLLRPPGPARAWLLGLTLVQALLFMEGQNPAIPRERVFPPTRTTELLAAELGDGRFLAEPGVLPANTGLVHHLACADGYDGLDVADFNGYRPHALRPGQHALLGWNARGMDLDSAAFRLLGVAALALRAPLEHRDWERIAGPDPEAPRPAEVHLHRARRPLPRAFCVPEIVEQAAVLAEPAAFDPERQAFLEEGDPWRPSAPFGEAEVFEVERENGRLFLRARLDGDGLLVMTDQHFPGWIARVDGERARLLKADGIFRGLPLEAGEHEVELSFEPASWRVGKWISLAGLLLVAGLLALRR